MAHRRERRSIGGSSDFLGGRVGGDELGIRLFDRPQLADEGVVLGIGDLRVVELVVPEVVVLNLLAQIGSACGGVAFGHESRTYRRGATKRGDAAPAMQGSAARAEGLAG